MKLPSWPSLIAAAGGCSVGLGCIMFLVNKQRDQLANQSAFVTSAINIAKEQETVKELLGDEIQVGRVSLNDGWGKVRRLEAQLRVPLRGDRDSAYLYAYARRNGDKELFNLCRLEATFGKVVGKKLVIMDKTNQENINSNVSVNQNQGQNESSKSESKVSQDENSAAKSLKRKRTAQEIKEEMKSWTWR